MLLQNISEILSRINGCTFASLDVTTKPAPGVTIHTDRLNVLLFTNKLASGYEAMVKRRLVEAGKDPDSFTSGELPWGEAVINSPLVKHKGEFYLKTIPLRSGECRCFIGLTKVPCGNLTWLKPSDAPNQGLDRDKQVRVRTFKLSSIRAIRLMGEEVVSCG